MANEDFVNSVENATLEIISRLYENMQRAGYLVEGDARKNAPIDQGQLRASMFSQTQKEDGCIVTRVGNSAEYAPYVHQGTGLYAVEGNGRKTPWCYYAAAGKYKGYHITRGQKPNPFLDKAKMQDKDRIEQVIRGEE